MSKRVRAKKSAIVQDIMSEKLVSVDAGASVQEVAKIMVKKNVSSVILSDGDKTVGILTERDLIRNVCAKDDLASKTQAASIMSTPVQAINKNSPVERAAKQMVDEGIRHLAVEDGYGIVGMVTTTDLARYLRRKMGVAGVEADIMEALYLS